jgi:hypothetical protein
VFVRSQWELHLQLCQALVIETAGSNSPSSMSSASQAAAAQPVSTVCRRPLGDKNATPPATTDDEMTALLDQIVKMPDGKDRQRLLKAVRACVCRCPQKLDCSSN